MSVQSSARRYAQALHQVATRNGSTEAVSRDLASLLQALDVHAELDAVFRTPLVAPRRKRALVEALLSSAPGTTGEVSRLLLLLAERDRLAVVREIAAAYDARVNAAGRMASAEIVTAVPLDRGRQTQLAQALGHATGQHVTITNTIDPSIVGGVVARVGGVVYDGSVVRQLERLKETLTAAAD